MNAEHGLDRLIRLRLDVVFGFYLTMFISSVIECFLCLDETGWRLYDDYVATYLLRITTD